MVGGSAEVAQPAGSQVDDGQANRLAGVEFLRVGSEFECSAFDHADAQAGVEKFARQRDARGAGADNAEIALDNGSGGYGAGVNKHAA